MSTNATPTARPTSTAIAAIDIGSNSTNLLVVDPQGNENVREVRVTALGEGVATSGVLSPTAIERTLGVVRHYNEIARQHGATLHITGTAACRMARNTDDFFSQVHAATGAMPRLLSPDDEARLAWLGAAHSLPSVDGYTMVIDIGGASTELTVGDTAPAGAGVAGGATAPAPVVLDSVSLPIGVVSLTESELHSDPPRAEELSNAVSIVGDAVDNAVIEHPLLAAATRVVGVAGSIVTIAAVELGLAIFDASRLHGMVLTRAAAEDVFRTLATESLADRVHNPGLPLERAGVIVGGCCVLVAIMRRLGLDSIVVSTHNLLDGVVAEVRAGNSVKRSTS